MRTTFFTALALLSLTTAAVAESPDPGAPAAYSTAATEIGTLLDDPAARAILDKHIPEFTANEQVDMSRGMTLRSIQEFAPDMLTNDRLAAIDADLAALPPKK
jgi:hypothetical protein